MCFDAEPTRLGRGVRESRVEAECRGHTVAIVRSREWINRSPFRVDQGWGDLILDQTLNIGREAVVAGPVTHSLAGFEVRREMLDTVGPSGELDGAKSTARGDIVLQCDPGVHGRGMVGAIFVEETKVLTQVVFAKEKSGEERLLSARDVVVELEVPRGIVKCTAEYTINALAEAVWGTPIVRQQR